MHNRVAPEQGDDAPASKSSTSSNPTRSTAPCASPGVQLKLPAARERDAPEKVQAAKTGGRSSPARGRHEPARPLGILARAFSACGGFSRQRRGSRAKDYRTKLLAYSRFDSYKLNGEDSQLHWDATLSRSHRHVKLLQFTSTGLVLMIGFRRRRLLREFVAAPVPRPADPAA